MKHSTTFIVGATLLLSNIATATTYYPLGDGTFDMVSTTTPDVSSNVFAIARDMGAPVTDPQPIYQGPITTSLEFIANANAPSAGHDTTVMKAIFSDSSGPPYFGNLDAGNSSIQIQTYGSGDVKSRLWASGTLGSILFSKKYVVHLPTKVPLGGTSQMPSSFGILQISLEGYLDSHKSHMGSYGIVVTNQATGRSVQISGQEVGSIYQWNNCRVVMTSNLPTDEQFSVSTTPPPSNNDKGVTVHQWSTGYMLVHEGDIIAISSNVRVESRDLEAISGFITGKVQTSADATVSVTGFADFPIIANQQPAIFPFNGTAASAVNFL